MSGATNAPNSLLMWALLLKILDSSIFLIRLSPHVAMFQITNIPDPFLSTSKPFLWFSQSGKEALHLGDYNSSLR